MDGDDQVEALAPPRPAHEPQVGELGHALRQVGVVVPQLSPVVLVIARTQADHRAILYITETHNLFRDSRVTFTYKIEQNLP